MSACFIDFKVIAVGGIAIISLASCHLMQFGSTPPPVYIPPPTLDPIVDKEDEAIVEFDAQKPPTAEMLESRPGFLLNPYTGTIVDVRGIPSGTLVRDPNDPEESHTFYVP